MWLGEVHHHPHHHHHRPPASPPLPWTWRWPPPGRCCALQSERGGSRRRPLPAATTPTPCSSADPSSPCPSASLWWSSPHQRSSSSLPERARSPLLQTLGGRQPRSARSAPAPALARRRTQRGGRWLGLGLLLRVLALWQLGPRPQSQAGWQQHCRRDLHERQCWWPRHCCYPQRCCCRRCRRRRCR